MMRKRIGILSMVILLICAGTCLSSGWPGYYPNPFADAKIQTVEGLPTLLLNGKVVPPFAYMSYLPEVRYYKEAADAGFDLFCFTVYLGDRGVNSRTGIGAFRPSVWKGLGEYDFAPIEREFDDLLEAHPDAYVILRLNFDVPTWWEKQYPEECSVQPDGSTLRQSFSSDLWRKHTADAIVDTINWLRLSPYAKHLAMLHLAAGNTEEWFYHFDNFDGYFYDLNPARTKDFRASLRKYYNNDLDALRKAWDNDTVTFANAQLADISGEGTAHRLQEWRHMPDERNVIDTFRFHTELIAENIIYFCDRVKKETNGHLLTGVFYGYNYRIWDSRRGHGSTAMDKVLRSDSVDFLSSPNDYHRSVGQDWMPQAAIASVQRHGKLWLAESDTRTHLTTSLYEAAPDIAPKDIYDGGVWLWPHGKRAAVSTLLKDAARKMTHGYGGWWFDMWGGWYSDPDYLDVFEKVLQMAKDYPSVHVEQMQAQACVVIDGEIGFWDRSNHQLRRRILSNKYVLAKTVAPLDVYEIGDWPQIDLAQYKTLILLGVPELGDARQQLLEQWRNAGKTIVWIGPEGSRTFYGRQDPVHENKLVWNTEQYRELFTQAGVHLYTDSDDIFYIGRGWMSLHSTAGGTQDIKFPFRATVIDPVTKKVLANAVTRFEMTVEPESTTILRVEVNDE